MPQKDLTTPHQLQVEKLPLQEIFVGPASKFFNEFLEIQFFIGPPDCFFPQVLLMAFLPTSNFGENTLAEFLTQTN